MAGDNTLDLIQSHVSVRDFTGQPVDLETLHRLIACGQSAATSSFIQAYSIVRVTDPAKRAAIAAAAGGQQWVIAAPEFLVLCADLNRLNIATEKAGQGALDGQTEHSIAAVIDVALMAQNMLLAAESLGMGGVFIGGIRNDPAVTIDQLQLPHRVMPLFGLCLGYPAHKNPVKPRMPVTHVLHTDSFDASRVAGDVDDYDAVLNEYYQSRGAGSKNANWSDSVAPALQGKKRQHMLSVMTARGFFNA
ncbi:oxygen-insensitive NADPH nitroreductase [Litorivicinus lipolyticus]|uniref:Oxygen-insensitive NADPH nitroreductase n=2 Tax=Litorivicinus lipolyticus TaxID=418701 RepID=A0A5Q2QFY3_9GAMM|nr:oxygen-insensitive NADPH nitroreductase [Litorivicinus lipolyticus]